MIVYTDTNFILELIFKQDHNDIVNEIIAICQKKNFPIHIPAYAIVEPIWQVNKIKKEFNDLSNQLKDISRDITSKSDFEYPHQEDLLKQTKILTYYHEEVRNRSYCQMLCMT